MQRIIIFLFCLLYFGLGFTNADMQGYDITDYTANFTLREDGILGVEEDIVVNFTEPRHGIYRDIPIVHDSVGNTQIKTPVQDVDIDGKQFSTSDEGKNYRIKIGSPDFEVSGRQDYPIRYEVRGAVRQFSGYQELYRNMLGTERNVPIKNFTFTLSLPEGVELGTDKFYAVKGVYGSKARLELKKEGNQISNLVPLDLNAKEGVTISVTLPDGTVPVEEFFVEDSLFGVINDKNIVDCSMEFIFKGFVFLFELLGKIPSGLFPFGFFILFLIFFAKSSPALSKTMGQISCTEQEHKIFTPDILNIRADIFQSGRNGSKNLQNESKFFEGKLINYTKRDFKDVVYYDPPKGYSPAEVSLLYADGLTWESISATLCDWQVRGYVSISTEGATVITKKKEMGPEFSDFERWLWKYFNLDENEDWNSGYFRSSSASLGLLQDMLFILMNQYRDDVYLAESFDRIGGNIRSISPRKWDMSFNGMPLSSMPLIVYFFLFFLFSPVIVFIFRLILLILSGELLAIMLASLFIFPILWPILWPSLISPWRFGLKLRYTQKGKEIKEHIFGFKKYLKTVEQEKLEAILRQDPSYFEKILPYAIAMGVGEEWVKRCGPMINSLEYYQNDQATPIIIGSELTSSLSDSMSWSDSDSSDSSFDSTSSSSDFGSSSSSDGSGSSGGGGGGGGGGSW